MSHVPVGVSPSVSAQSGASAQPDIVWPARLRTFVGQDGSETLVIHESDVKILAGLLGRIVIRGEADACGLRVRVWGEGGGRKSPEETPPVCDK